MWPLFATTAAYAMNTFASEALSAKCTKFMITCILQYEISLRMKFSKLHHDLLFRVMT